MTKINLGPNVIELPPLNSYQKRLINELAASPQPGEESPNSFDCSVIEIATDNQCSYEELRTAVDQILADNGLARTASAAQE